MAMKKEMSMKSEGMMCPGCKVPMSQCGCWGKMKICKGLVLLVVGVLFWGSSSWAWASWFTLEHVVALLLVLFGLKMFVWGCMSCKGCN